MRANVRPTSHRPDPCPHGNDDGEDSCPICRRDAAISRVRGATPSDWRNLAMQAVKRLAEVGEPFTTDEVWHLLPFAPPEPRALGAVMKDCAARNLIHVTGHWRPSRRPEAHARPVAEWIGGK
jgi:hypothetical protein